MFLDYFELTDQPFGSTPDPRFLLETDSHREALASLYTGYYGNRGFTVLVAEPGMGKTTLLFKFLDHIREQARTVFLFNTLCQPADMLSLILQDLGLPPAGTDAERHQQLNELLAAEARDDRRVVLVIDEAQNLPVASLEAIRLLSNFETPRNKLMQIVLAGQPQLTDRLAQPELAQLRQRVSTLCRLSYLSAAETTSYIEYRLQAAGYSGDPLFTADACRAIAHASQGIPRIINTLCFNSLCLCSARNVRLADDSVVTEAIADLQLPLLGQAEREQQPSVAARPLEPPVEIPAIFAEVAPAGASTRYLIAALLSLCVGLAGAGWWMSRSGGLHIPSMRPALSHLWPGTRSSAKGPHQPIPPMASASAIPAAAPAVALDTPQPPLQAPGPAEVEQPTVTAAQHTSTLPETRKVKIGPDETLATIARANLGAWDGAVLRQIRALNPRITNPNHIETGSIIRLPERSAADLHPAVVRSHQ